MNFFSATSAMRQNISANRNSFFSSVCRIAYTHGRSFAPIRPLFPLKNNLAEDYLKPLPLKKFRILLN